MPMGLHKERGVRQKLSECRGCREEDKYGLFDEYINSRKNCAKRMKDTDNLTMQGKENITIDGKPMYCFQRNSGTNFATTYVPILVHMRT